MNSLKIKLLPLAICLLLSLNSQVSGKPSPKHFLIETKEKAKKSSDYVNDFNNSGLVGKVVDGSTNVDYVNNLVAHGGGVCHCSPCPPGSSIPDKTFRCGRFGK